MKKTKKILSLLLISTLAVGMTLISGCSQKTDDPSKSIVLTINDKDIYMNEMMYYIMAVEATGAQYEAMYQQYMGTSYWDQTDPTDPEGKTVREQAKEYIIDNAQMYEILYDKAVKEGYTLTDEEKTQVETYSDEILSNISDEQLKITGFTKEVLTQVQEKLTLAGKYYNDLLDSFEINEDDIKSTINRADYKQYKTEYLFVSTTKFDENNNSVELTDKEKAEAKETINAALKKVKAGKEFSAIAEENDQLLNSTLDFIPDDGTAEEAYQTAALGLENNEFSDVVETKTGYYIIKMVDNDSSDAYDSAVASAVTQAQQDAFDTEYENLKKDYTITINSKVWDPIVIGNITIISSDSTTTESDTTTADTTDSGNTSDSQNISEENTTTGE